MVSGPSVSINADLIAVAVAVVGNEFVLAVVSVVVDAVVVVDVVVVDVVVVLVTLVAGMVVVVVAGGRWTCATLVFVTEHPTASHPPVKIVIWAVDFTFPVHYFVGKFRRTTTYIATFNCCWQQAAQNK